LLAPINLRDKTIGVLKIGAANDTWDEDVVAMVDAVVDQIAQTAENLRLFEETSNRAGREQTIREITDKLRAAPDIDSLLETAARELGGRLGVQRARLKLGREQGSDQTSHNGSDK
jgi:GAF domain-containing protein